MKTVLKTLIAFGLCGAAHAASAAAINVTVDGRSGPWDQSVNPTLTYDAAALAPTVIRSSTGSLVAGTAYMISFVSGETQTVSFYGKTDGRGYSNIQGGVGYPSQYVQYAPGEVSYLQELMGAFADSTGKVIGNPFLVGNFASIFAPTGASEILLGINDNHYADNLGALTVSVSGTNISAVPLPASAPMFGAALFGLAGLGYAAKRKKVAAAWFFRQANGPAAYAGALDSSITSLPEREHEGAMDYPWRSGFAALLRLARLGETP